MMHSIVTGVLVGPSVVNFVQEYAQYIPTYSTVIRPPAMLPPSKERHLRSTPSGAVHNNAVTEKRLVCNVEIVYLRTKNPSLYAVSFQSQAPSYCSPPKRFDILLRQCSHQLVRIIASILLPRRPPQSIVPPTCLSRSLYPSRPFLPAFLGGPFTEIRAVSTGTIDAPLMSPAPPT